MLSHILTKAALFACIAAETLCVQSTVYAQKGTPNQQGSSSVNDSTAAKAGPVVVGDIGGGYTFKGPMTGPFSVYNRNNELVGTTQNQMSPVITNDAGLQKVYADNQKAHGGQIVPLSMHIEMPANKGAAGALGAIAASTTGGNLGSQQKIPDGAIKAPNGLYVSMEDVKNKKGKTTKTTIKVVDPNATLPTGIMFEYFPASVGAGLLTSLGVTGPSDYSGTAHIHPINLKPLGLDGEPIPGARVKTNYGGKGERIEAGGLGSQLAAIEAVASGFNFDYKAFRGAFPDYGQQPKVEKGSPRVYNPSGPQQ